MQSVLLLAAFCSVGLAQPPSVESDGDVLVLRASGGVKFVTKSGGTISLQEMVDTIQLLQDQVVAATENSTANVDTAMVEIRRVQGALQDSIDAAAKTGVVNTAEAAASLNSRVDALVEDMTASKSAMDGTMEDFAKNIKVIQAHVEGVVTCAKDGLVHDGDDCIATISTCKKLTAPTDGTLKTTGKCRYLHTGRSTGVSQIFFYTDVRSILMVLLGFKGHDSESTPGVTAHLSCKEGTFAKGVAKITCLSTGEWSDELGACTECTLKGCALCSTDQTCGKCNPEYLLSENDTCEAYHKSCADLYNQGERKNGFYSLKTADMKQTYKQHCILEDTEHYTGGWTRFVRIEPGCESLNAFDNDCSRGYTKSLTGCWEFDDNVMSDASDRQVMGVGQGEAKRQYIAKPPGNSGQDFVDCLTGDRSGAAQWYDWRKKSFVQGVGGSCGNVNDHTQWNCGGSTGLAVVYSTRNCMNDGGHGARKSMFCEQCSNNEDWYFGFSAHGRSQAENLERFIWCDGECGWDGSNVGLYGTMWGDQHGIKRTAMWMYYK